jgi:2-keto-3-deoxy-L-rhamnonate aldolase RhmA
LELPKNGLERAIEIGFGFVAVGSDLGLLARHGGQLASSFAGLEQR